MNTENIKKGLLVIVGIIGIIVAIIVPEVLVFFNQEARDDWGRMFVVAVTAPFIWSLALGALIYGILMLYEALKNTDREGLPLLIFSFALIYPGIRIPHYWIKRIVIDEVPAFGYNPDNIYAVAGLNSMSLGPLWAIEGAIAGLLLYAIIYGLQCLSRTR